MGGFIDIHAQQARRESPERLNNRVQSGQQREFKTHLSTELLVFSALSFFTSASAFIQSCKKATVPSSYIYFNTFSNKIHVPGRGELGFQSL